MAFGRLEGAKVVALCAEGGSAKPVAHDSEVLHGLTISHLGLQYRAPPQMSLVWARVTARLSDSARRLVIAAPHATPAERTAD